ncbi:prephenate dehydratase [Photobacterium sp. WH77]|uniref:Bifunctional chorismate mutase/prephenate dehydratase n=2 Tax=Photobacterium TaxID=657 RepID=A0ABR9BKC0_9GAMM|nr:MULTISPECIES: prephenate dehydratase [Photobacterium]MBD8512922.1 prephenate dehydratase [Photobacterium arenosum]MBV7261855.1 prephenate dehydratase [Photobacterium sp. WH24]MCG2836751.1 prephenate dehydratase [Photobacterium sp. WH77]MCG2844122.1 prephenate dehydratase [Photobacterium sp. WH80]MDO6583733.1 prephenate dehydratase [Photobacterium sp. 2_MG-2023]
MTKSYHSLDEIRTHVTRIDNEILALLAERRQLSLEVAKSKIKTTKPVRDQEREQALLLRLIDQGNQHQLDANYVTQIFHTIIEDSVLFQQAYLQKLTNPDSLQPVVRVSFLGAKGSYSNLASRQYFSRKQTKLVEMSCSNFRDVVNVVETGQADYGVLPIENTSSGSINEVYDLLQHTSLSIVGEITQPIEHCLLTAVPTSLDKIDTLYSHPQPHQQCSEYLRTMGDIRQEYTSSTADAMQQVAELKQPNVAAIGNASSGELYGLTPLKTGIANQQENFTRFIVVARKAVDVTPLIPAKTTLIMSTGQKPGSLVECLLVLRNLNINMAKLESRPVIGNPWEEMFYVDVETNLKSEAMQQALEELTRLTKFIKVLGCYPSENVKPTEVDYLEE